MQYYTLQNDRTISGGGCERYTRISKGTFAQSLMHISYHTAVDGFVVMASSSSRRIEPNSPTRIYTYWQGGLGDCSSSKFVRWNRELHNPRMASGTRDPCPACKPQNFKTDMHNTPTG